MQGHLDPYYECPQISSSRTKKELPLGGTIRLRVRYRKLGNVTLQNVVNLEIYCSRDGITYLIQLLDFLMRPLSFDVNIPGSTIVFHL